MLAMNKAVFVATLSVWGFTCFILGSWLKRRLERREKRRTQIQSLQDRAEAETARLRANSQQTAEMAEIWAGHEALKN